MRDDCQDAMMVSPNHGLQDQPNIPEEEHPLNFADRTEMKEEAVDDKASDSGISPDHCSSSASPEDDRIKFSEHLIKYYTSKGMPEFITYLQTKGKYFNLSQFSPMSSEDNLESPLPDDQSDDEEPDYDYMDEPGIRVPRVNSQGKIKTFTCKQCGFTSVTKLEFWDHNRGHIRVEKLLTCPKCPFVTEYKHHLEYHLRNHFGSKPFKCDKCSYSCVNKSMLNSHLKSHSNIYQYRCANCSYATKYLHSLKLHLRKYTHQPAMVLNADGTPNPLPIVDVYGTRRGPKQKNLTPKMSNETKTKKSENQNSANKPIAGSSRMSPNMNPMNVYPSVAGGNGINPLMALQYNQMYNASTSTGNPFGINEEAIAKQLEQLRQKFCAEYAQTIANEKMNVDPQEGPSYVNMYNLNNNAGPSTDLPATIANINAQIDMTYPMTLDLSPEGRLTPLDLSKPDTSSNNNNDMKNIQDYQKENCQQQMTAAAKVPISLKTSGTSRRKGKAFKLAPRDVENKIDEYYDNLPLQLTTNYPIPEKKEMKMPDDKNINYGASVSNNEFICQFCEIAFGNEVMYTVHMGYHGYKNPFVCNMCGHQSEDKLSFFLHIARSKHA